MSFGPSQQEKTAMNNETNVADTSAANSKAITGVGNATVGQGNTALAGGGQDVGTATNYFRTLANGNQANTTALLQPNIDQIRQSTQQQLQGLSTLQPRGGGRSGSLFAASYAPQAQIQGLFNGARGGANGELASLGQNQQALGGQLLNTGTNLFGAANSANNTSLTGNNNVDQAAFQNRQASNAMWGQIGGAAVGLATLPFGGSGLSALQRL